MKKRVWIGFGLASLAYLVALIYLYNQPEVKVSLFRGLSRVDSPDPEMVGCSQGEGVLSESEVRERLGLQRRGVEGKKDTKLAGARQDKSVSPLGGVP